MRVLRLPGVQAVAEEMPVHVCQAHGRRFRHLADCVVGLLQKGQFPRHVAVPEKIPDAVGRIIDGGQQDHAPRILPQKMGHHGFQPEDDVVRFRLQGEQVVS